MAKITINAHDVIFTGPKLPAFARVTCNQQFVNDDDETVTVSMPNGTNYVKQVAVTNAAGVATIASFSSANQIDSSVDVNGVTLSTYNLSLHDVNGNLLLIVYSSFKVPLTPTTTTWANLAAFALLPSQPARHDYYDTTEIDRRFGQLFDAALRATDAQLGVSQLSRQAENILLPIAVGDNDPRVASAGALNALIIGGGSIGYGA